MGKYSIKRNKKEAPLWLIPVCAILLPIIVIAVGWFMGGNTSGNPSVTDPSAVTQPTAPNVQVPSFPTIPDEPTQPTEGVEDSMPYLHQDLRIDYMGSYAGIFMEDGTDEIVSDAMMLILENTGEQDLQLARINLQFSDFVAAFEVTNLPAGQKVVLLERSRHAYVAETPISAEVQNVVFFQEPMSLLEDKVSVTGGNGYIELTNITDQDLNGEFFVYYKNSASDLLYGGITYRVRISDGLAAGDTVRVMTSHYHPDRSAILMVSYSG